MLLIIVFYIFFFPAGYLPANCSCIRPIAQPSRLKQCSYFLELRLIPQIEPLTVIGIGDFLDAIRQFPDLYADRTW